MTAYYNEIDPYAAQWIRNLIAAGHLPAGVVDERSIEDVRPSELRGFAQCHFFAGIGGWPLALRLCGWPDDRPVWSGSCPCQPFAAPGQGLGFADQRHLWPAFHHLIGECRPARVFGEQVASRDADPWIDLVQDDLEALGYAFGAIPFPACGAGADQIRERLYWLADAAGNGRGEELAHAGRGIARNRTQGLTAGHLSGGARVWRDGLDGRRRPLEPGIEPVRDAFPGLLEQLRAYGNALDIGAACLFVECVMDELGTPVCGVAGNDHQTF
jgi:DNA (cytosine-5)-methyltransferase 1